MVGKKIQFAPNVSSYLLVGEVSKIYQELQKKLAHEGVKKYHLIDFASPLTEKIAIEEIRRALSKIRIKPAGESEVFYFLLNANLLNSETQNSLLKIVEEPPSYLKIIFICAHKKFLLPTLLSRLTILELGQNIDSTEKYPLKDLAKKELYELFKLSEKITKANQLESVLNSWLLTNCSMRDMTRKRQEICHELLVAKKLLSTNTNKRLLLDNIFLKIISNTNDTI